MQAKTKLIIGGVVVGIGAIGLSIFFALSDDGQIDVNNRIRSTDQTNFEQEVLPETRAVVPNGGLVPQGSDPVVEPPKPTPEPVVETSPEVTASASSTEEAEVSADDAVNPAPEAPAE